jgi:hypothetical protein
MYIILSQKPCFLKAKLQKKCLMLTIKSLIVPGAKKDNNAPPITELSLLIDF